MKQLLIIVALLSCSAAFAQTQKDYELAMAKFQRYYNNGNVDSIVNMYSDKWGKQKQNLWTEARKKEDEEQFGKMLSFKYEGVDNTDAGKVRFFLVTYDKSTHAMSFSLDKKNKFLTFRPMTMSDYINSKLAKYYKGEGKKFFDDNK